jgi:hypothetical protein
MESDMDKAITRMEAIGVRDEKTGCLRWTGSTDGHGYGQVRTGGRNYQVHRIAYETHVGEIPEGYVIDHVYKRGCRHKDCFEPTHLEAVTHQENMRRCFELITHCKHGHEYTPENTYYNNNGRGYMGRKCRICMANHEKNRNRSRRG